MSGSRRARTLVTGIQNSLSEALALADQLDAQADRIEAASRASEAPVVAAQPDGRVPTAVTEAAAVVRARCSGLASASWAAAGWHGLAEAAGTSSDVPAAPRFRPGLW
nr:hypothetical protein [Micromonospora sp. DSM 115978]